MYSLHDIEDIRPDPSNPRTPDPNRLHLLRLSVSKLGFILPVSATRDGLVLSGHQRLTVAKSLGLKEVPVQFVDVDLSKIRGINVMYNRVSNDLGALDTGSEVLTKLDLRNIVGEAEKLPDATVHPATQAVEKSIVGLGADSAARYDKKAIIAAENFLRLGAQIPIVVSESGEVVNGVHRLFAARENGIEEWPIVTIPDAHARFASHFLNYLSMDYAVDAEFADLLRYSAYRRPQNNRGQVPKAYRYWANGMRTLPDRDSYSTDYWVRFRDLHGKHIIDYGAGLGKVAPYLNTKGFNCIDFEPYRIRPDADSSKPDPDYSKKKVSEFLQTISSQKEAFDSIFMASVLNSIPFPKDRMAALVVVHALSGVKTGVYGTCRDISDFHYEYSGIRQANYFVFDSEPGVRLGDAISNPKIQKFMTQDEATVLLKMLWNRVDTYPGGNVFYWEAHYPKRVSAQALSQAIELAFERQPYSDGTIMGKGQEAVEAFSERLKMTIPRMTKRDADKMFATGDGSK